jgi:outer membrane lipoprotein LolB
VTLGGCAAAAAGRGLSTATRWAAITAAAALLAACASLELPPAEPGETVSGRLSVQVADQPERGISASFELQGSARQGQLLLSGPLGTTLARAVWSPDRAVLTSAGSETRFTDLDSLSAAALGEALPMAALFDWLRGRPWPGAASQARGDGVPGFEQLGWQVDLARWSDGWVEARRTAPPAVTVRARLEPAG